MATRHCGRYQVSRYEGTLSLFVFLGCQHLLSLLQPADSQQEHGGLRLPGRQLLPVGHGRPQSGREERGSVGHSAASQEGLCPVLQVRSEISSPQQISSLGLSCSSHDAGASALVHANQHHLLISAGKKGQICIWDVRQAKLLHTFKVSDDNIKGTVLICGQDKGIWVLGPLFCWKSS